MNNNDALRLADELHKKHDGTGLLAYCEAELRRLHALDASKPEPQAQISSCCGHASDCAVHNAPALPAGPCDCGFEPQVQSVDPEVVAYANPRGGYLSATYIRDFSVGLEKETYTIPLITLQSHREAIAKKDAALRRIKYEAISLADAQVIALEALK